MIIIVWPYSSLLVYYFVIHVVCDTGLIYMYYFDLIAAYLYTISSSKAVSAEILIIRQNV